MSRLTGVLGRLGGRPDDRGAVAALVAVLLAGGVLLGMSALVVDVGLLYAEREQLQSGADAASIAVAKVCLAGDNRCTSSKMSTLADEYASANAKDNLANAAVCGRMPAMGALNPQPIPACGPSATNLTACIGDPPADPTPYVEVRTTTEVPNGTVLPPVFAGAITGTNGATVGACSRVSWGAVGKTPTPLGIAVCGKQFDAATLNNGVRVFQPPPLEPGEHNPAVDADREIVLQWRSGADPDTSCGGAPDGFMFIDHDTGGPTCPHTLEVGTVEHGTTAEETPSGCADDLEALVHDRRPFPVAVYNKGGPGGVTTAGIAMFMATGWRYHPSTWSGGPTPVSSLSTLSTQHLCGGAPSTFCLYGYFTTKVFATGTGPVSADNFGAVYLKTIG